MFIKAVIIIVGIIVILAVITVAVMAVMSRKPLSGDEAMNHLKQYFNKAAKSGKAFSGIQVLIKSDANHIDEQFAFGQSSYNADKMLGANQPFHIASIGKIITATLVMMLSEEDRLKLADPISNYIEEEQLASLFVFNGIDYANQVTIAQLMAHTSGIADYFADKPKNGETLADLIISDPNRHWTPQDLLAFNRSELSAVGIPGFKYHYSDSGYVLLGLLIEMVESKPFDQVLRDRLFVPLGMKDSYMAMRSKPESLPAAPISDIWFQGTEVSQFKSLTVDWAGGGIVSTPRDLLAFQEALHGEKLIGAASLNQLFTMQNKFQSGIYYGLGAMEIRFEEFFPLLRGLPRMVGHIGVLSTHMFYDRATGTQIIMNFGSDANMVDSFKAQIEILTTLKRIQ